MTIELDLNLLDKHDITPNQFIFCYLIYRNCKIPDLFYITWEEQRTLFDKELIKQKIDNFVELPAVTPKFINLVKNTQLDIKDWIEEYRNLFPKGVQSGGYLVRGDKKGCIKKMKEFINKYPEYADKELILKATEHYIDSRSKDGYTYLKLAHYFIDKDGVSLLASYCELVKMDKHNMITSPNTVNL